MKLVVFTDLDGTLLDAADYSFGQALPAMDALVRAGAALVLCSSKTRAEIELYRKRLGNADPFISENGGGVFIPRGALGEIAPPGDCAVERADGYELIRLGAEYGALRRAVERLRAEGYALKGFGDMDAGAIASATGLALDEARLAMMREFDEPYIYDGDPGPLAARINELGFRFTTGRLMHIMGASDKGRAVGILSSLYRERFGDIKTVALGDAPNDFEMLRAVDVPVLVAHPDGSHASGIDLPGLIRTKAPGPSGWAEAVMGMLTGRP